MPEEFEFSVWGATILLDAHWKHEKGFIPKHQYKDLFISGIGTIKLSKLIGGTLEVFVYEGVKDKQNRTNVVKNHDGSELILKRQWGSANGCAAQNRYLWECVMVWPYGFCNLNLYCDGTVSFEYEMDDSIFAEDYLKEPQRYLL